jgi:Xaa-Pro aminopeptidase
LNTAARIQQLRDKFLERELDGVLVSQAENRRYLSGLSTSAGYLLISSKKALFATDFRYAKQASIECADFEVVQIRGELSEWLPSLISELGTKKLGFEANATSFAIHNKLSKALDHDKKGFQLLATESLVESLRAVKDEEELAHLSRAAELADSAIEYIKSKMKPGVTEKSVAWDVERFLRDNGSEELPFHVIVASGPNSAFPHATPTDRRIQTGEPITIDLGARIEGYCSDITRTVCLGSQDSTFTKIYDLVLGSQLTALATLHAGMKGEQADSLARTVIDQAGYQDSFGHGLGHGVGLAPHENPRLGYKSEDILDNRMVFTVEPGVYLPGWGGVRIEDMVMLDNGQAKVLTRAEK